MRGALPIRGVNQMAMGFVNTRRLLRTYRRRRVGRHALPPIVAFSSEMGL
jgi:hypothetical protein